MPHHVENILYYISEVAPYFFSITKKISKTIRITCVCKKKKKIMKCFHIHSRLICNKTFLEVGKHDNHGAWNHSGACRSSKLLVLSPLYSENERQRGWLDRVRVAGSVLKQDLVCLAHSLSSYHTILPSPRGRHMCRRQSGLPAQGHPRGCPWSHSFILAHWPPTLRRGPAGCRCSLLILALEACHLR